MGLLTSEESVAGLAVVEGDVAGLLFGDPLEDLGQDRVALGLDQAGVRRMSAPLVDRTPRHVGCDEVLADDVRQQ